ncbi:MAG: chromate transporter [Betaproteobacteria bacterium]|nr:chromate transporter [Betaproteobacteria bacterium]
MSPAPGVDAAGATLRAPASCRELFTVFTRLALQGFGGVLPVAQRELVERQRWLSTEQFLEMLALGQVLPGPNVINLALMVGQRFFGLRGALAAMAGMICVPLIGVLVLAVFAAQTQRHAAVNGALRGMGVVAAGLVLATALRLSKPLMRSPLSAIGAAAVVAATFVAIGVLRWPLVAVVLGLGGAAFAAAAWRLRAAGRAQALPPRQAKDDADG